MKRVAGVVAGVVVLSVASFSTARPGGGSSYSGSSSSSGGSRSGSSSSGSSRSGSSSSSSGSYRSGSSTSSSGGRSGSSSSSGPAYNAMMYRDGHGGERSDVVTLVPYGPASARPDPWPEPNEMSMGPVFGIAVGGASTMGFGALGLLAFSIVRERRKKEGAGWSTQPMVVATGRAELDAIRTTDPDFSIALFEDFLYALYAETHTARGAGKLEQLSPYVRPQVRAALAARARGPVSSIVIGAMRFVRFDSGDPSRWSTQVEFEANWTEGQHAYWVVERWWLSRARTARSRPPERARVLACPSCGAPLDKVIGGTCRHCNTTVDTGTYDWVVDSVELVTAEPRGPMLTGTVEEQGTDLPTVVDPQLDARLAQLTKKDPSFSVGALQRRVGLVFETMQLAWSSLEWQRARPFLSDNLWEAQRYWIEAYQKSGLRNVTERTRILRIDTARVTEDKWFDAITVRVYATGLDYTLRVADGAVVGGNRARERTYSEYWTFLRGSGTRGAAKSEPACPQCGAALSVTMAGTCTHCKAKVNSPAFDWVLARIEQDEAYTG